MELERVPGDDHPVFLRPLGHRMKLRALVVTHGGQWYIGRSWRDRTRRGRRGRCGRMRRSAPRAAPSPPPAHGPPRSVALCVARSCVTGMRTRRVARRAVHRAGAPEQGRRGHGHRRHRSSHADEESATAKRADALVRTEVPRTTRAWRQTRVHTPMVPSAQSQHECAAKNTSCRERGPVPYRASEASETTTVSHALGVVGPGGDR